MTVHPFSLFLMPRSLLLWIRWFVDFFISSLLLRKEWRDYGLPFCVVIPRYSFRYAILWYTLCVVILWCRDVVLTPCLVPFRTSIRAYECVRWVRRNTRVRKVFKLWATLEWRKKSFSRQGCDLAWYITAVTNTLRTSALQCMKGILE